MFNLLRERCRDLQSWQDISTSWSSMQKAGKHVCKLAEFIELCPCFNLLLSFSELDCWVQERIANTVSTAVAGRMASAQLAVEKLSKLLPKLTTATKTVSSYSGSGYLAKGAEAAVAERAAADGAAADELRQSKLRQ